MLRVSLLFAPDGLEEQLASVGDGIGLAWGFETLVNVTRPVVEGEPVMFCGKLY